jgi:hypothetical protein
MFTAEPQSTQNRRRENFQIRSPFPNRSKLLADRQFGLFPLLRFVASARWRASGGARRLFELSSLPSRAFGREITFPLQFWAGERHTTGSKQRLGIGPTTANGSGTAVAHQGSPAEVLP